MIIDVYVLMDIVVKTVKILIIVNQIRVIIKANVLALKTLSIVIVHKVSLARHV